LRRRLLQRRLNKRRSSENEKGVREAGLSFIVFEEEKNTKTKMKTRKIPQELTQQPI